MSYVNINTLQLDSQTRNHS